MARWKNNNRDYVRRKNRRQDFIQSANRLLALLVICGLSRGNSFFFLFGLGDDVCGRCYGRHLHLV